MKKHLFLFLFFLSNVAIGHSQKLSYQKDDGTFEVITNASFVNNMVQIPITTKSIKLTAEAVAFTTIVNNGPDPIDLHPTSAAGVFTYTLSADVNKVEFDKPNSNDKFIILFPPKISYLDTDQTTLKAIPLTALNSTFTIPVKTKTIRVDNVLAKPIIKINDQAAAVDLNPVADGPTSFVYVINDNVTKIEFDLPASADKYTFVNGVAPNPQNNGGELTSTTYQAYIFNKYDGSHNFKLTPFGLMINRHLPIINGRPAMEYLYGGVNYIHIFLDEFGNSLITTIPQGIPNMTYVVHIIYSKDNSGKKVTYGVTTTGGKLTGGINIEGSRPATTPILQATSPDNLEEAVIQLKTPGSDLSFTVSRYEDGKATQTATYTLEMGSNYTAYISAGLLNSWLGNPSYSLVNDPNNSSLQVAKSTGGNNRGFVTIFATVYVSPITLIRSAIERHKMNKRNKNITDMDDPVEGYQEYSKNYLDLRPVYERIYPIFGVGLNDNVFQNLFFGLSWEFARGASFFGGGHYGKVNVFNAPGGFLFEKSNLTQDQFNLYQNTAWKVGWSVGVCLDFSILGNLFKSS